MCLENLIILLAEEILMNKITGNTNYMEVLFPQDGDNNACVINHYLDGKESISI